MGATSNSQTLCGLPIVKVLRYWCIFDGLCCLIGIGLCIAFATTEDRNVRVTFGVGAVLAFFMMAADVILLVGLRNGHKPLILLWQMAEPLFAIFTLALFQLGQAYALKIHPPCEADDGVRICNALVRLSLLFFGLSVICLLYYTLFFRYVHSYRKKMTSEDQDPILPNPEQENTIQPEIHSSNPFE